MRDDIPRYPKDQPISPDEGGMLLGDTESEADLHLGGRHAADGLHWSVRHQLKMRDDIPRYPKDQPISPDEGGMLLEDPESEADLHPTCNMHC
jgi:hypothetical protein